MGQIHIHVHLNQGMVGSKPIMSMTLLHSLSIPKNQAMHTHWAQPRKSRHQPAAACLSNIWNTYIPPYNRDWGCLAFGRYESECVLLVGLNYAWLLFY